MLAGKGAARNGKGVLDSGSAPVSGKDQLKSALNGFLQTHSETVEYQVDEVETSAQLAFVRISESGISSPLTIKKLRSAGYQGFLIGESFMRMADPASAFSDFVKLII